MKERKAATVGFAVATLIPAVVLSALWPLDGTHRVSSILGSFVVFYPFSAAATILLGLPAFLLLRRFRPGQWWSVIAVGLLLGVLVAIIIRLPSAPNPRDFLIDGPIGALTALVFWLIWRRGVAEIGSGNR